MPRHEGEHPFAHSGQILAFVLFVSVWGIDSLYWHLFVHLRSVIPLPMRIFFSIMLFLISFVLIKDGRRALLKKGEVQMVLTDGMFRISRHPLYLGVLIFYLALSVLTVSVLTFLLLAFIFIYYDFLARYEEKYLYLKFGKTYLTYWKQTPRWVLFKNKFGKKLDI